MPHRLIVFVCTGNICRSPMAECLFREAAARAEGWEVRSAGLAAAWGMPASREAVEVLAEQGLDLRLHSSRPLTCELAGAADLLVVMTAAHRDLARALFPQAAHKVVLLRSFDPGSGNADVEDPIGAPHAMYRKVRDEIAAALPGLAAHVRGQQG
jgi:protein-tyrosine-phosphatase